MNTLGLLGGTKQQLPLSAFPVASHNGAIQRSYWHSSHRKLHRLEAAAAISKRLRNAPAVWADASKRKVASRVRPDMAASLLRHAPQPCQVFVVS
jgi:hypothetical protein